MITETLEKLVRKGIKPSPQRVAILTEFNSRRDHPTVDMIFASLRTTMPTLSRTTVYNTVKLLLEHRLLRDVRTDDGEVRYDGKTHFHAHFKCRDCGMVYDVELPEEHNRHYVDLPEGFEADDEQLTYYGHCPKCAGK